MSKLMSKYNYENQIESVGKILLSLRKSNKLTLDEAASFVGVSASNLSQFEDGKKFPSPKTASKLAELYGVSWSDVLK